MVARLSLLIFLFEGNPGMTALWAGWLEVAWALPQIFMASLLGAFPTGSVAGLPLRPE